ncbi:MAG: chloride channel protein [Anaerolineae bacterium]
MRVSNLLRRDSGWVRLFFHAQHSENTALLVLAVGVGLTTAIGVWLFRQGIDFFHRIFVEQLADAVLGQFLGGAAIIVALALAGVIVGWLMNRFIGDERHHGVAGIMEAEALAGGRLRYTRMPFKALASALSLGAGASVGPEDPSVQIGANLGSFFGQKLHLSSERVRVLVAAGGGAAIAAAFRAPIAGVFFAVEVILNGELATRSFGVVVLACVVSSVFTQAVETSGAEFGALNYTLGSLVEMPLFALLGLVAAPVCVLFIRAVYWQHDLWHHYAGRLPRPARTALAGVLVAIVGIFLPQILGTGRETMSAVLSGEAQYAVWLLLIIAGAKLLMTTISMAGGFVGGIFAPALVVGTMLGAAFGEIVNGVFSGGAISDSQAYAIAGMAALMAGVVRAPITAIMLVFELTNDYRLILPIMLASVTCVFVAELFERDGVYAFGLARKGIRLKQERDIDLMQALTVRDAMITPAPVIRCDQSLVELRDGLRSFHAHGLIVVDQANKVVGIATLSDLQKAYESGISQGSVDDICAREVITTEPDEPLWTAVRNMGQRGIERLPVVDPVTGEPVGVLTRDGIMSAYNKAISRKIEEQHAEEQVRLHTLTGAHVVDYLIRPGADVIGKKLKDVTWPPESSVAAIRRGERLIVPHGSTELCLWDTLTVVTDPRSERDLAALTGQPRRDRA